MTTSISWTIVLFNPRDDPPRASWTFQWVEPSNVDVQEVARRAFDWFKSAMDLNPDDKHGIDMLVMPTNRCSAFSIKAVATYRVTRKDDSE